MQLKKNRETVTTYYYRHNFYDRMTNWSFSYNYSSITYYIRQFTFLYKSRCNHTRDPIPSHTNSNSPTRLNPEQTSTHGVPSLKIRHELHRAIKQRDGDLMSRFVNRTPSNWIEGGSPIDLLTSFQDIPVILSSSPGTPAQTSAFNFFRRRTCPRSIE